MHHPNKRKPCPYCGTPHPLLAPVERPFVMCRSCCMSGPKAASCRAAERKWNELPRPKGIKDKRRKAA